MLIHKYNNFCRVFELPETYPMGYCFLGGISVEIKMVDWFNPIPLEDIENNKIREWSEYKKMLIDFLENKIYIRPGIKYLVITDFNEAFTFIKGDN